MLELYQVTATSDSWMRLGRFPGGLIEGCHPVTVTTLSKSRTPFLSELHDQAQAAVRQQFRARG